MRATPAVSRDSERGQVLIIIALGLFLVMLGASALAIDWGNGLLQKRRLQAAADAAALAAADQVTQGHTFAEAFASAQDIVSDNTHGAVSIPATPTGSGTNLSSGMEITLPTDVRVALVRQVQTMFASILGVNSMTVRVRSRATAGPFGVLPITMKRFSEGDTSTAAPEPDRVLDNLAVAEDSPGHPNYISAWPDPLTDPGPPEKWPTYTSVNDYDATKSGPVAPLVGRRAVPNTNSTMDFHFFVAPDIRQITQPSPDLYNSLTLADLSSTQLIKDISVGYILAKGYPGPNPLVGEQLATFSGAPTDHAVDAMRQVYNRGDLVATMVYDGTLYRKPGYDLTVNPPVQESSDISTSSGSPLNYAVSLVPSNGFSSGAVQFAVTGLEGWADWAFGAGSNNTVYTMPVPPSGASTTLHVSSATPVSGARVANIRVYDPPPGSGTTRTASATVVVGSDPCYSVSTREAFKTVEQGSGTRFDLDLEGWNGYPSTDVQLRTMMWYNNDLPPTPYSGTPLITYTTSDSSVRVWDGHASGLRINIDVDAAAPAGQYVLMVPFTDGDMVRDQKIFLTINVIPADSSTQVGLTTSFVKVLGYANFVITYANNSQTPSPSLDNNTIWAYAVTPLISDPSDLSEGMSSRLVGWNQTP